MLPMLSRHFRDLMTLASPNTAKTTGCTGTEHTCKDFCFLFFSFTVTEFRDLESDQGPLIRRWGEERKVGLEFSLKKTL